MNTLVSFAGIASIRVLTAVSQLIIIAAASQVFSKDEFGRFAISYALVRLLQAGSGLGAQSYLLKDIPYRQVHGRAWHSYRSATWFFLIAPFLICVLAGVLFESIGALEWSVYPLQSGQGASVATFAFLWTIQVTLASYVRTLRSSTEAMLLKELAAPAALLVTMMAGWLMIGEVSIVGLFLGSSLLLLAGELTMFGWHLYKKWIPVGGGGAEAVPFKELKAYWGTVRLNTMTSQFDIVLAGIVLSPAAVGLYTIIKRITSVMLLAVSIVVWMYAPKISRASAAADLDALTRFARRAMQFTLVPATIVCVVLLVALPWWTAYFEIATDSTFWIVFSLMLSGQVLSVCMGSTMMFATQTGQPMLMVSSLSRAVLIVAPLILIAGSIIGIVGVAAMQLVMIFLMKWPVRRSLLVEQGLDVSLTTLLRGAPSSSHSQIKE